MERIYPKYREADVVILASPLYYWFISGFLKNTFDRLFAVAECDGYRNLNKESILIMAAEGAGFEESEELHLFIPTFFVLKISCKSRTFDSRFYWIIFLQFLSIGTTVWSGTLAGKASARCFAAM